MCDPLLIKGCLQVCRQPCACCRPVPTPCRQRPAARQNHPLRPASAACPASGSRCRLIDCACQGVTRLCQLVGRCLQGVTSRLQLVCRTCSALGSHPPRVGPASQCGRALPDRCTSSLDSRGRPLENGCRPGLTAACRVRGQLSSATRWSGRTCLTQTNAPPQFPGRFSDAT